MTSGHGGSSNGTAATGSLAYTGTDVPVMPTVAAGLAAVALGAGAVAVGRKRGTGEDADQAG